MHCAFSFSIFFYHLLQFLTQNQQKTYPLPAMEEEYEDDGWMGRHRAGDDEVKYYVCTLLKVCLHIEISENIAGRRTG